MMPVSSLFWAKALAVRIATVTKAAIESRFGDIFPPRQGINLAIMARDRLARRRPFHDPRVLLSWVPAFRPRDCSEAGATRVLK
jgi:hypothetical protein